LSNAIKFSKPGKTIRLQVSRQNAASRVAGHLIKQPSLVVMVDDEGPGIAKSQQAQIFKQMFNPAPQGGTGLGLYMTKAVIDRSGGDIWFTSQPRKGSRFFVSFPLANEEEYN
jgi:signal transduction histidine kinase